MADTIRELAEQEPEQLRQQIDDTRSSITEKLEALEEQVTGTVQNARDTVEETIQSVKESVQDTVSTVKDTFNLSLQVERHPWGMLGGALMAGLVGGAVIGEARRRRLGPPRNRGVSRVEPYVPPYRAESEAGREPARRTSIFGRFEQEVDQLKGLGLGLLLGVVRDVIQENAPQVAEQVGHIMDNITTKLGGQPHVGPVLANRHEER
jgi:ElaB/YqjD/DUF883 family membrane-anchored ribosome-binding protein